MSRECGNGGGRKMWERHRLSADSINVACEPFSIRGNHIQWINTSRCMCFMHCLVNTLCNIVHIREEVWGEEEGEALCSRSQVIGGEQTGLWRVIRKWMKVAAPIFTHHPHYLIMLMGGGDIFRENLGKAAHTNAQVCHRSGDPGPSGKDMPDF